jgi:hypothetical protein
VKLEDSMKRPSFLVAGVLLVALGSFLVSSAVAVAHERRAVGEYTFVVGWINEPAIINQPNAVDLRVTRTADGSAVTGIEQTLRVEVRAGEERTEVQLRPRFNQPGAYDGRMIPTELGAYSFVFTGTIEGSQINETFTAGQGTFGLIEEGNAFPNPLVTNQELEAQIRSLEQRLENNGSGGSAMTVAIIGVLIGALGLVAGGYGLTRKNG